MKSSGIANATIKAMRTRKDLSRAPVVTPWGFKFSGPGSMENGTFEQLETEVVRTLLEQSDRLINVGANVGYYCLQAIEMGKQCVAFEPHPENVAKLLRNLALNGMETEVYPVACGSKPGALDLYGGGTAASLVKGWAGMSESNPTRVPVVRLDDVIGHRFDEERIFLLMDVEGAELQVLEGCAELLTNRRNKVWMLEVSIDEHMPDGAERNPTLLPTFEKFFRAGYRAWTIGSEIRETSLAEIEAIAAGGENTLKVHNFLFSENPDAAEALSS